MIHVIATISVKPGKRAELIDAFHKLLPEVLAEDGCIAYGPTVDVATGLEPQQPARDNAVIMVEQWESLDHLKAHLDAPHMHRFREANGDIIEGMDLVVTEPA